MGKSVAGAVDKLLKGRYKLISYLTSNIKINFRTIKELGVMTEDIKEESLLTV